MGLHARKLLSNTRRYSTWLSLLYQFAWPTGIEVLYDKMRFYGLSP